MLQLIPEPADLASLLVSMCTRPWPTTEDERLDYFRALRLHDGRVVDDPPDHHDPDRRSRWFTTSLPGQVEGIGTTFRDQFLGLTVFAYNERVSDAAQARDGYARLKEQLSQELGDPVEEWGPPTEPACLWRPGELVMDMYCFQRRSSGIMVGPSHAGRSADSDAAAIQRQQAHPGRPSTPSPGDRFGGTR